MKVIEEEQRIRVMEDKWEPLSVIREIVASGTQEDPFYVMDLGEVVARYNVWKEVMPRVQPFYAVKCNDEKLLLTTLAALGAGFDCASKMEIEQVMGLGVSADRIIFANPAKLASHVRHAESRGVRTVTFDSETELIKIKAHMPNAKLVIRIRSDALSAQCPLGIKFGCDPLTEAPMLLKVAAILQLEVVGVSFHVGSGATESAAYPRAIAHCRHVVDVAATFGHRLRLVDIGGGFPGHGGTDIREIGASINSAIETHFPDPNIQIIAEPGRYFAAAAYTLACLVHAKREVMSKKPDGSTEPHTMYFINDGVYGSFNCVLYDHQVIHAEMLNPPESPKPLQNCSIWGPSCDGLDCVIPNTHLPPIAVGSWLVFRNMGAYTIPIASPFNGFPLPGVRVLIDKQVWPFLRGLRPLTEAHFVSGGALTGPQRDTPPPSPPAAPTEEFALK